ncbi:MAG: GTPase [Symploca sp. SIO1B1]|nr:GTPase [Symploca sp. SIO2D2]NER21283.1 GTPase [Symploca sp. SIO1C2]NER48622.1 GTPase [Symploca sp. SIO1A3]NER94463.1 GTPase [Symploca sp. SIO1B1]
MKNMRLVVTGPVGAGKSTFVRTASEIEVVQIERTVTDDTSIGKQETTVAFDFGKVKFGPDLDLQIYGTPGQSRFDFMWDILIQDAQAYILLVAAHRPDDLPYARSILSFMEKRVEIPMIIGLTHMDCSGALSAEEITLQLGYVTDKNCPPIVTVNPNLRSSVLNTLMTSMELLIPGNA